jgi:hypothetical protein
LQNKKKLIFFKNVICTDFQTDTKYFFLKNVSKNWTCQGILLKNTIVTAYIIFKKIIAAVYTCLSGSTSMTDGTKTQNCIYNSQRMWGLICMYMRVLDCLSGWLFATWTVESVMRWIPCLPKMISYTSFEVMRLQNVEVVTICYALQSWKLFPVKT